MLSQVTETTVGTWAAVTGLAGLFLVNIGQWLTTFLKDRREREENKQKAEAEQQKFVLLQDISKSNNQMVVGLGEVKAAIGTQIDSTTVRYEMMRDSIREICKANCGSVQIVNQPQTKNQQRKEGLQK